MSKRQLGATLFSANLRCRSRSRSISASVDDRQRALTRARSVWTFLCAAFLNCGVIFQPLALDLKATGIPKGGTQVVLLILEIKGSRSRGWSALVSKCRKCQVTVNDSVGDDKFAIRKSLYYHGNVRAKQNGRNPMDFQRTDSGPSRKSRLC
jgi:hypothetical protein